MSTSAMSTCTCLEGDTGDRKVPRISHPSAPHLQATAPIGHGDNRPAMHVQRGMRRRGWRHRLRKPQRHRTARARQPPWTVPSLRGLSGHGTLRRNRPEEVVEAAAGHMEPAQVAWPSQGVDTWRTSLPAVASACQASLRPASSEYGTARRALALRWPYALGAPPTKHSGTTATEAESPFKKMSFSIETALYSRARLAMPPAGPE